MTVLTAAAFAIALQCGDGVDPDLLGGFVTVESAMDPLAIHQNVRGTPGITYLPRTIDDAMREAAALIAEGQSVDTGPFQINNKNLDLLQISLLETFDTCHAAAAAGRLLKIMSRYNSGSPTAASGYAKRVTAAVAAIKGGSVPLSGSVAGQLSKLPPAPEPSVPEPVYPFTRPGRNAPRDIRSKG